MDYTYKPNPHPSNFNTHEYWVNRYREESQRGRGFFEDIKTVGNKIWRTYDKNKDVINPVVMKLVSDIKGRGVIEEASRANIKFDKMKQQHDNAQIAKLSSIKDMVLNKTKNNIKSAMINAQQKSLDNNIPLINTKPVQYNIRSIIENNQKKYLDKMKGSGLKNL